MVSHHVDPRASCFLIPSDIAPGILVEIPDFVGPLQAIDLHEHWNGWTCPAFNFDQACELSLQLIDAGQVAGYDAGSRSFFAMLGDSATMEGADDETLEVFAALNVSGRIYWPIGAWGWCWETVDPAESLALAFVAELQASLTPEQYAEMRRRNATPEYFNCCASHDFIDANESMSAAFLAVFGRHPRTLPEASEVTSEQYAVAEADEATDADLWNAAWDIAKREHLTGYR